MKTFSYLLNNSKKPFAIEMTVLAKLLSVVSLATGAFITTLENEDQDQKVPRYFSVISDGECMYDGENIKAEYIGTGLTSFNGLAYNVFHVFEIIYQSPLD